MPGDEHCAYMHRTAYTAKRSAAVTLLIPFLNGSFVFLATR